MGIGMNVGGATHSSHLIQPIEFRMNTKSIKTIIILGGAPFKTILKSMKCSDKILTEV